MELPSRVTDPSDEIGRALEEEMKATVSFYSSSRVLGGAPTLTLLLRTKARVTDVGSPTQASAGGQALTLRQFRVQIPLLAYPGLLPTGTLMRVNNGYRDHSLEVIAYKVLSAVNSSRAGIRTIECISDLTPVGVMP